jgi:hypothetical protein
MTPTDTALRQWLPQVTQELLSRRSLALRDHDHRTAAAFDRAMDRFEHGEWARAFAELVPLADAGDREAARIALLMAIRGPRLFGRTFASSPAQRERWSIAAGGGERTV